MLGYSRTSRAQFNITALSRFIVGNSNLSQLANHHGTDKEKYCPTYEKYFASLRNRKINLFEIGVGGDKNPSAGGASLKMWKDYFPRGSIFALDLYDKSSLEGDRIMIYQGSQDDTILLNKIASEIGCIDIIVDDGSHISEHVIKSFEVLFPLLSPGGIYIIEDIGTSYWPLFGGSTNLADQKTSMAYFKKICDGINHEYFKLPYEPTFKSSYEPTYADKNTKFIHFYNNLVILQKIE